MTELLRHLPYIYDNPKHADRVQVASRCEFANWELVASCSPDEDDDSDKVCSESPDLYENMPPHVVGLTYGHEFFVLDTELGIVHWYECPGEIKCPFENDPAWRIPQVSDDPYDWAPEEEAEWRAESGT